MTSMHPNGSVPPNMIPDPPHARSDTTDTRWTRRRIWTWLILGSISTAIIIHHFLYSSIAILGVSMAPTLLEGERLLVNRWRHRLYPLQHGQLIVFREPKTGYEVVKRIVALPADTIQLREDGVYLNGSRLTEPYVLPGSYTHSRLMGDRTLRLGPAELFVMGDNRLRSQDSRWYGPLPINRIIGTVRARRPQHQGTPPLSALYRADEIPGQLSRRSFVACTSW